MNKPLKLLIIEDSEDDALLLCRELRNGGYHLILERVETSKAMLAALKNEKWDIVISDYFMPGFSGLEALKLLKENSPDIPFIIVSGKIGEDTAVEAMRAGADDYLVKGNLARLAPAVERELRESEIRRKRLIAEEALDESEERFRIIAATATDAIIMVDKNGIISYGNPAIERIFLYEGDEFRGKPFYNFVPPAQRKRAEKAFKAFLKKGDAGAVQTIVEFLAVKKDGRKFPVEVSVTSMKFRNKWHAAGIVRDVTDRKQVEKELTTYRNHLEELVADRTSELQSTNELLTQEVADRKIAEESLWTAITKVEEEKAKSEAIISALGDGIVILDSDFRTQYQNRIHEEIFGNQIGRYCYEAYFENGRVCEECPVARSFEDGKIHRGEKIAPSGKGMLNIEITASPLRDGKGKILAGIAVVRDVTQRRRMEDELRDHRDHLDLMVRERTGELRRVNKELRAEIMRRIQMEKDLIESQRFVHSITDATPNLLYLYDVAEGQTMYINPRVKEILGYSPDEVKKLGGAFYRSILHPADWSVFTSPQKRFSETNEGEIIENEYRLKNSKGEWRWFSSREVMFKRAPDGQLKLVLGIAEDITEKKMAQQELKESREQLRKLLAHLQSVREDERTKISREIHDELGQALTALKMDLAWTIKRIDKDNKPLIEKARMMSSLVDMNIQTVKRIAAELRPGLLDVLGLSSALEWQAKEFQERTGIKCKVAVRPEDITLDRNLSTAIFRIFQETLTNVVRHAKAKRVTVDLTQKKGTLTLTVKDDGKGITEKEISAPTSIGLMGMRERVHFFGGKVTICGEKKKGTSVIVSIPLGDERIVRQEPPAA